MKSCRKTTLCIFILTLLHGCTGVTNVEREKAALMQIDRDFSEVSEEKGVTEAFRTYLTEDAISLPAGFNPVFGKEAVCRDMASLDEEYILSWKPQDGAVAGSGDLGYTWGTYTLLKKDDNDDTPIGFGKYLTIWKKQDGIWKAALDMGNPSPAPEPENP